MPPLAYLVTLGVAENRLSSISYGKEKPKVQGHNDESWLINRRCEFKLQ
jgi:peptidoglycan-associated lipoprotein